MVSPVSPRASRPAVDDIPVARRSQPQAAALRARRRAPLLLVVAGTAAVLLPLGLLSPLRQRIAPSPMPGLAARPSSDGRLLGHFPYPEAPAGTLSPIAPGLALRREAALALGRMQRAAADEGVELQVLSAYRPIALQKRLFFDVKADRNQDARTRARVSAPPGFSEHSTGFAVDLGDARLPATNLSPEFEQTPAYRWLVANANRFHFTLSFPRGNRQGVSYEPWHWRYEGSTDALRLFEPAQRLAGG